MKKIFLLISIALFVNYNWGQNYDTITCNFNIVDTVKYVKNKSTTLTAISINTINNGITAQTDDGYKGYGQKFEAPDTVTLNGFCFYAFMYTGTADTAVVKIYNTTSTGALDSILDSARVAIPLKLNYSGDLYSDSIKVCVDLNTPLKIKGDYAITVENNTTSDMYVVRNTNGLQEDLAYTYYYWASDHTYDGWYNTFQFGSAWDFDIVIEPIISHQLTTQHILNKNRNCFGDTIQISSSMWYNDTLFTHKMYNLNYSNYADTTAFAYNWGDTINADTSHVYSYAGAYNAMAVGVTNFSGWTFTNYIAYCPLDLAAYDYVIDLGNDTSICHDSLVLTPGQYFNSYLWNTADTTALITIYADSLSVGINEISVRTELNGCLSYDTILVTANELFIDLGSDTNICLNQQLVLATQVQGDHYWSSGQLTDSVLVGPFNAPDSLLYSVEVDNNGCLGNDSIWVIIDNCVGITENQLEINVFPNPAKDWIQIITENQKNITISIYDLTGKKVLQKREISNNIKLNVNGLKPGSYVVEIKNEVLNYKQILQIIE